MATSVTQNLQTIYSISQLDRVVREAERQGEQVVFLGGNSVRIVKYNALEKAANWLVGQNARQATSLDRFAATLRESELRADHKPLLDRGTRIHNLVGKTIDATVASEFLGQVQSSGTSSSNRPIQFDGTGRIQSIAQDAELGELELFRLESGVVQDLRSSNSKNERDVARTESECLLQALGELRKATAQQPDTPEGLRIGAALSALEKPVQTLWLSGQIDKAGAHATLNYVATELSKVDPELSDSIAQLAVEASKSNAVSQRHDNAFGRMFESSIGKHLADNPTPKMLEASSTIRRFMLSHILTPQKHFSVDENINIFAESLIKDSRPWHAEVPIIQDFLSNPNADTLRTLLEQTDANGYQMMATYWMAAKFSSGVTGPWMNAANDNYNKLIKPSRSSDFTPLSEGGVEHTANAYAVATKILDGVTKELDRPGTKERIGNDIWRTLRNGVQSIDVAIFKASGSFSENGQLLPADRDAILTALNEAPGLLGDQFPTAAEALKELYKETLANPMLEVGTRSANMNGGSVNAQSNQYGTGLAHQPKPTVPDNWVPQVNIPSKSGLNVNLPSSFEKNILDRGQNTVNGVSGTTNMLTFLLLHMEKASALVSSAGDPIDIGEALAGNLTFLVMDGGHSIPEAMATSASILAHPKYYEPAEFAHISTATKADAPKHARAAAQELIRIERQRVLDHYVTDYSVLGEQLGGPETAGRIAEAVSVAFESTRKSFDTLHQTRLT